MNYKKILTTIQELNEYVDEIYNQLGRYITTNNNKFLYICMDDIEEISTIINDLKIKSESGNNE